LTADDAGEIFSKYKQISESEFFEAFDKVYASLCLNPVLNPVLNEFAEPDEFENGSREDEDASRWTDTEGEKQLSDHEKNFYGTDNIQLIAAATSVASG
jgi:hypothetical protein